MFFLGNKKNQSGCKLHLDNWVPEGQWDYLQDLRAYCFGLLQTIFCNFFLFIVKQTHACCRQSGGLNKLCERSITTGYGISVIIPPFQDARVWGSMWVGTIKMLTSLPWLPGLLWTSRCYQGQQEKRTRLYSMQDKNKAHKQKAYMSREVRRQRGPGMLGNWNGALCLDRVRRESRQGGKVHALWVIRGPGLWV